MSNHAPSRRRGSSVCEDWQAWLSPAHTTLFRSQEQTLENSYAMFSVALNEALELYSSGRVALAYQTASVLPDLCVRLTTHITGLLRALGHHSKHNGTIPSTAPLDHSNFRSARGLRAANRNGLLSRVLFTERSQFLHKATVIRELVEDLQHEVRFAAEELGNNQSVDPEVRWEMLDVLHYDLNTCLREGIVMFKSFLRALPGEQIDSLEKAIQVQIRLAERPAATPTPIRRRRIAAVAGR